MKTRPDDASVEDFLNAVPDPRRRADCFTLLEMMTRVVGAPPQMWGASLVGFGSYSYRYASGRSGEWFLTGFSPRKRDLTVYIMPGFSDCAEALARLGKHRTGKSCLYLKYLDDVDPAVLETLVADSVADMRRRYASNPPAGT